MSTSRLPRAMSSRWPSMQRPNSRHACRTAGYDPNWGDIVIEAQFSDYEDVGDVKLPKHIVTKQDHWTTTIRGISRNTLDAELEILQHPRL